MRAATLIAWADAERERINNPRPPSEQTDVDKANATIRSILSATMYEKARSDGWQMTTEQIIAFVLDDNQSEGNFK